MSSGLRKRVKDLGINKSKNKDFDPEDDLPAHESDGSEDSDEQAVNGTLAGREHYEKVRKSNLRKPGQTKLDEKKYGGKVVSRAALDATSSDDDDLLAFGEEEEDEDPFAVKEHEVSEGGSEIDEDDQAFDAVDLDDGLHDGEDDEIDSDEAFEDGEEESFKKKGFVFRGSGKAIELDDLEGTESEDDEVGGSDISDENSEGNSTASSDVDMEDPEDKSTDSEDDDEESDESPAKMNGDRAKIKALLSSETAAVATSLSQAGDARKGTAVRHQYETFDRLLDSRIKLQKGLTAANDLATGITISDEEVQTALEKAEQAALRLFSTIESLRNDIIDSNTTISNTKTKKRKRPATATSSTSSSDLWTRISVLESHSLPHRRAVLDKWSNKTRTAGPISSSNRSSKLNPESQSKLTSILDTYLLSESSNLILQSKLNIPSTTTNSTPPTHLYTDAPYYQSLLRDLITSKSHTSNITSLTDPTTTTVILPLKLHTSGNTKRKDTKASKGRKVRYTVHEKLQNFTAGTGMGVSAQWTDEATREFFGSLMGQQGQLDEDEEGEDINGYGSDNSDSDDGEREVEVEALRLFRS